MAQQARRALIPDWQSAFTHFALQAQLRFFESQVTIPISRLLLVRRFKTGATNSERTRNLDNFRIADDPGTTGRCGVCQYRTFDLCTFGGQDRIVEFDIH